MKKKKRLYRVILSQILFLFRKIDKICNNISQFLVQTRGVKTPRQCSRAEKDKKIVERTDPWQKTKQIQFY